LPKTARRQVTDRFHKRVAVRIPGAMMGEVDRIVKEHPELDYNRQQFVESAVREKIERVKMLEGTTSSNKFIRVGNHLRPL
jgi:metal-responsive CopG/Arc/MetJ family transcriptional regulator